MINKEKLQEIIKEFQLIAGSGNEHEIDQATRYFIQNLDDKVKDWLIHNVYQWECSQGKSWEFEEDKKEIFWLIRDTWNNLYYKESLGRTDWTIILDFSMLEDIGATKFFKKEGAEATRKILVDRYFSGRFGLDYDGFHDAERQNYDRRFQLEERMK